MFFFLHIPILIGPSTTHELLLIKSGREKNRFVYLLSVRLSFILVFIFQFLSFSHWGGYQLWPPETHNTTYKTHFVLLLCCVTCTPFFFFSFSLFLYVYCVWMWWRSSFLKSETYSVHHTISTSQKFTFQVNEKNIRSFRMHAVGGEGTSKAYSDEQKQNEIHARTTESSMEHTFVNWIYESKRANALTRKSLAMKNLNIQFEQ